MEAKTPARVLIVEDDTATRCALSLWLEAAGYRCTSAATTGEAYWRCQREMFDCMVLDAQFDRTPGLALAERLAKSSRRPWAILVVTGHPPDDFKVPLRHGLIDGYLPKPVGPEALSAEVQRLVVSRAGH